MADVVKGLKFHEAVHLQTLDLHYQCCPEIDKTLLGNISCAKTNSKEIAGGELLKS